MIKILAIDDNPDNLTTLKAVIADAFPGSTFFSALNGRTGIEQALAEDPDVILLDIVMPGMDGFTVCRKLKEDNRLRDIPVIFLTALKTDRESRIKALETGAEAFLSKPIDEVELTAQIRAMIKIKSASRLKRMEKEHLAALVNERTLDLEAELAERMRAEDKIKQAQALTNTIIESIPGTFYMLDENGQYVRWNAYQRDEIVGKPEDQVAGTNAIDTIHPDDRALIQTRIANVLENGVAETVEGRVLLRGGPAFRWLLMTGSRMVIDGRPFLVGIGIDITERKQAEEALKESDQRHRDYLANTPYGVFVADNTGAYVQVNPSACQITGYQEHELLSMHISDLHVEETREQAARHFQTVVREGKSTGELIFRHKSGERRWWFVSAVKISDTRFLGFCNDITESKRAEMALQIREQTLQKIFDILPVGLWFADKNGKLLRGNPMGVKIWGAEPNVSLPEYGVFKARRLPSGQEIAPDDWALAHTIREGVTVSDELLEIDAFDGRKKMILNYTAPILDTQGEIQGAIVVNRDITESKQAEDALRESEERYRTLANNIPDIIYSIDGDGNIVTVNQSAFERYGYSEQDIKGKPFLDFVHPEDRDTLISSFLKGIEEKQIITTGLQFRIVVKNGFNRWFELNASSRFDSHGRYMGEDGILRDITDRKQAEDALRESEEKYRLIAENMSDVISVIDMNLKFTYVSPSIQRLTGFTVAEAIQHSIEEIVTPESYKNVMKIFEEEMMLEASGTAAPSRTRIIEIEQSKKDISIVWVEVACSFIRDVGQKPTGILLISRDITERKRAEAERERMMAAIEQAGEAIVITDTGGMIQYVNPAFEKASGYSWKEATGQNPRVLKSGHQDEIFYRQLWETISSGKTWSGRMVNRKKDGSLYTEDATISPVFDNAGRIINYVGVKRDVTEHLCLANQLQQTQKMEAIGTLAGGIAHDFNNILSAILGYTDLAMSDLPKGSDTMENLEAVYKAGNRAKDLVQQILAFSRQTEHQFFEIHIHLIIKEVLKLLRATLPATIEIKQNIRGLGRVLADPTQIHQVMMNLCVNASHAMSENGGELMISLLRVNAPEDISVPNDLPHGSYLKLTVRDTGCGIPPELQNRIFDPYFTTKGTDKGTGLGLSVVHGIVQSHGGCVAVESAIGKGSSFHVYLPEVIAPVKDNETIRKEETIVMGTGRILVVDDEPAVAGMLKKTLEKIGYEVVKRTSSVEALELFKAKPEQFDLVITDMTMPQMTGYELSRQLIEIRPDIPIILCSGFHEKISVDTNKAIGIREVVMKPILQHVLSQTIRKVLDTAKT